MLRSQCEQCASDNAKSSMYRVNNRLVCESCANQAVSENKKNNVESSVSRENDRTVCARCKTDYGLTQLPLIGNAPICGNCTSEIVNRPFPQWLKLSLAGLLALLIVSLVHGRPYFSAGRSLARGEKAINRQDYIAASLELQKVLKVAPRSQKAILLAAKAAMMSCDMETAQKTLNLRPTYERNALFTEVNGQWDRAIKAYDAAIKASKIDEDGKHDEEAAQLMEQASRDFPECKQLRIAAEAYTGGAAFLRKITTASWLTARLLYKWIQTVQIFSVRKPALWPPNMPQLAHQNLRRELRRILRRQNSSRAMIQGPKRATRNMPNVFVTGCNRARSSIAMNTTGAFAMGRTL